MVWRLRFSHTPGRGIDGAEGGVFRGKTGPLSLAFKGILGSSTGQRRLHLSWQRMRVSFSPNVEESHRDTASADLDIVLWQSAWETPPPHHPGNSPLGPCPQLSEELSQQLEAVCGSVFGELESQAVDALDLPGCFRMRSHSYLRAIQAGCSQDDDCLPLLAAPASVSGRPGSCEYASLAPSWAWVRESPATAVRCDLGQVACPSGVDDGENNPWLCAWQHVESWAPRGCVGWRDTDGR